MNSAATENNPGARLAIVGVGCLFPGADGLRAYWANICNRVDAIRDVPPSHWSAADYLDPDPKAPDRVYAARGGFLDPIAFPPGLYGIAPNNLEATDTSQLLALVAAREALLDAGYQAFPDDPADGLRPLDRRRVAVVLGVTGTLELVIPLGARLGHPLWRRALREAGVDGATAEDVVRRIADGYVGWQENSFPGLLGNVVAGRVANRLDLGGTNCVVDAACASSLGALHLACLELTAGRADVVVTGGVDTFNDVFMYSCFSKTPALSPTGSARPFDADADGTTLGEGLGVVVLKRLADAERDGDRVYAVVRGVGSSSDGKGNAVYAPKAAGQVAALRRAYELAGIDPETVELVEAHGTGTRVGDAIEVEALTEVYRQGGRSGPWCALGSVKSQIGHTKAAAGAAGLIKAAAALYHKVLPPTIKVTRPTDALRADGSPFYVNADKRPWLPSASPRRAAVSSFGFGGSNYHCILEEGNSEKEAIDWDGTVQLVAVSADTAADVARDLAAWPDGLPWAEVCARAVQSRAAFDPRRAHRLLLVVERDRTDLRRLLESALALVRRGPGQTPDGACYGVGAVPGALAVLFPGQGAQYPGMLRDLMCRFPVAFAELVEADRSFAGAPRLADRIYPPAAFTPEVRAAQEAALKATEVAQSALGAVSLAALRVLEAFDVRPDAAAGHSYGELVALCAAGRLTSAELHELSRERGRVLAAASAGPAGSMLAVSAPAETIQEVLRAEALDLVMANRNAPAQTVLSGTTAEIERAAAALATRQVRAQRLAVAAAFHSPLVAGAEAPFRAVVATSPFPAGRFSVFANSTAEPYPEDPETARDLLAGQLTRPVEWVGTVENLYAAGVRTLVEVGPGARLTGLVAATLQDRPHVAIALDASNGAHAGPYDLALLLARLAALGHAVRLGDWDPQAAGRARRPEEGGFTVALTGANHVKPRPASAPAAPPAATPPAPDPHTQRNGTSVHPMNNGTPPSLAASAHSNGSPPSVTAPAAAALPPAPVLDGSAVAQALQISRESMAVLQRLHEQTAQLHRQFLEGQESAQRTLHMLVEQQQRLLLASLGLPAPGPAALLVAQAPTAPLALPELPPPVALRPPAISEARPTPLPAPPPGEEAPAPPAATNNERVTAVLIEVVAEKTGYPGEMLELDMAMDADLGIDSIKRVEILSALQERLPEAPAVKPEHLGTLITLRHIAAFLAGGRDGEPPRPVDTATSALPPRPPGGEEGKAQPAPSPVGELLERSILHAVPLRPAAPRPALALPPDAEIWVTADDRAFAGAVEHELRKRGHRLRLLPCAAAVSEPLPQALRGLVLIAPPVPSDEFLANALLALRHVAPGLRRAGKDGGALLATVARLDGAFGLHGFDEGVDPVAAGLAGFAKTAGHEWPEVTCRAFDVSRDWAEPGVAAALVEELLHAGPPEVGLSRGGRVELELTREPTPTPTAEPPLYPGDVVVISGGARGVTAEAAVALARAFRPTLVLLGRSPEPQPEPASLAPCLTEADLKRELAARSPGASPREIGEQCRQILAAREVRQTRARLEAIGASVLYRSVDIRDSASLARVLEQVRREAGPIRVVVHGAGVLADALIADKTAEQFDRVYGTKVNGLRALLAATAGDDLRALVLFSSTTGRFGRVGQADYAAANEVLNKLAQREARRRPGCRVVAVNWGPWDGGMVTPALRKVFEAEGVGLIAPAAGADFLVRELSAPPGGPVEVVVVAGGLPAARQPRPAPGAQLAPAFECVLDPADHPVLASHVLDGRPVLPAALTLEWLAHGALHENPGLVFHGCDDLRILQGVILADAAAPRLRVAAGKAVKRDGFLVAPAELCGVRADGREVTHARADIVLAAGLPPAPEPHLTASARPYPQSVAEVYGDLLFHGPELQGIEQVLGCDANGIAAAVRTAPPPPAWVRHALRQKWLADPLVLDCGFQLLILWTFAQRGVGSLPCRVGRYRQYCRTFPPGSVHVVARVTHATDLHALADLEFLDEVGRVLARLDSCECVLDAALARAFRRNRVAPVATS